MIDSKKLRLITLSENTAKWLWLKGEWGLSILVETDEIKVLVDTGLHDSVTHNAAAMGIDLATVDQIVLSHGHADHTGGLWFVLEAMRATVGHSNFLKKREGEVPIIAHPDVWGPQIHETWRRAGITISGVSPSRGSSLKRGRGPASSIAGNPYGLPKTSFGVARSPCETILKPSPPYAPLKVNDGKYADGNAEFIPDPVDDDAALYIKTDLGLVIVLGCAHHGMIKHDRTRTGSYRC